MNQKIRVLFLVVSMTFVPLHRAHAVLKIGDIAPCLFVIQGNLFIGASFLAFLTNSESIRVFAQPLAYLGMSFFLVAMYLTQHEMAKILDFARPAAH